MSATPDYRKIQSLIDEYPKEWRDERRLAYLHQEFDVLTGELSCFYDWYHAQMESDLPLIDRLFVFEAEHILEKEAEQKRLSWQIRNLERDNATENQITNDMIYRAKEYSWDRLIETKRGMAKCPFHDDKSPSMLVRNGFAYCFSCLKAWDTIGFVRELEGLSFPDAVRRLL